MLGDMILRFALLLALARLSLELLNKEKVLVGFDVLFGMLMCDVLICYFFLGYLARDHFADSFLLGMVLIAFAVIINRKLKKQWYVLKTGFFRENLSNYEDLGEKLRNKLWLMNLPPASIVLYRDGRLFLYDVDKEAKKEIERVIWEFFQGDPQKKDQKEWGHFVRMHFAVMTLIIVCSLLWRIL